MAPVSTVSEFLLEVAPGAMVGEALSIFAGLSAMGERGLLSRELVASSSRPSIAAVELDDATCPDETDLGLSDIPALALGAIGADPDVPLSSSTKVKGGRALDGRIERMMPVVVMPMSRDASPEMNVSLATMILE